MARLDKIREELYTQNKAEPPVDHRGDLLYPAKEKKARFLWQDPALELPTILERSYLTRLKERWVSKRFLVIAGAAILIGVAVFLGRDLILARPRVEFTIVGSDEVSVGEPTVFTLRVVNKNNVALKEGLINLTLPDGSTYASESGSLFGAMRQKFVVGDVPKGGEFKKDIQVRFAGSLRQDLVMEGTYVYRPENIQSLLIQDASLKISVVRVPVVVTLDAPEKVSSGQEVSMTVGVDSELVSPIPDLALSIDFPAGFEIISTDPPPVEAGENIWALGDFDAGTSRKIAIRGKMKGEPEEVKALHIRLGRFDPASKTWLILTEVTAGPSIASPLLLAQVSINGLRSGSVAPGASADGNVYFKNNLPEKVQNVNIAVSFPERFVELETIRAESGFYDAIRKAIVWDPASEKRLAELRPGEEGTLAFSFKVKGTLPIFSSADKNFLLPVAAVIASPNPPAGYRGVALEYRDSAEFKIESRLLVSARAAFYDSPAPNSGPLPPRVRRTTTYTIYFQLSTGANDLKDVEVKAGLPGGVGWQKVLTSSIGTVAFNPSARQISWRIPRLSSGTGIIRSPAVAVAQVALTPADNQIGSSPVLANDIAASGLDTFTNTVENGTTDDLTTALGADTESRSSEWAVVK
ncbi:MAG: hypothetical protein HYT42_00415 [Candidatus Sungbacteria bacterium]|nr:hypothetical protein [Candidatus Sungbacteria bacterium]